MNTHERLKDVRKIVRRRTESVYRFADIKEYRFADLQEAVLALCEVIEEIAPDSGGKDPDQYRTAVDSSRWILREGANGPKLIRTSGPGRLNEDVTVMSVAEHERQMEVLRHMVRDNDMLFGKVRNQRDALLRAIQDIQMAVFPCDTELFGKSEEAPFEDLDNLVETIKDAYKAFRERNRDLEQQREDMRRAMLAQRQSPPAPDLYVGRGRYDAAVAEHNILREKLREVWNLTHTLAEALRLTQEYVGDGTLPHKTGWSWYDALTKYHAILGTNLDNFANIGCADEDADMVDPHNDDDEEYDY